MKTIGVTKQVNATATTTQASNTNTGPSLSGPMLFNGASTAGWALNQSASPGRVQNVADPAGGSANALEFTTLNSDIAPATPTDNPRSQLVTPMNIVTENIPFWESYEVYVPTDFPIASTAHGWFSLGTPFYGKPWAGTPSTGLAIDQGDFRWQGNAYAPKPWEVFWQEPVTLGAWTRFTWYIDPAMNGFAELYVNDVPVVVTASGRQVDGVALSVIDPTDDDGPWFSDLQNYYKYGEMPSATVYFKNFAIGTTQAAAES